MIEFIAFDCSFCTRTLHEEYQCDQNLSQHFPGHAKLCQDCGEFLWKALDEHTTPYYEWHDYQM